MDFNTKYIDELIAIRKDARQQKNWKLSDEIRDYLDEKKVFIFDQKDEQVIYHTNKGTRQDLIEKIKMDQRAQSLFDAWLYSTQKHINKKNCQNELIKEAV